MIFGTKPFHPMESSCDQRHEQQKSTGDKMRGSGEYFADSATLPHLKNDSVPEGIPSGTLYMYM